MKMKKMAAFGLTCVLLISAFLTGCANGTSVSAIKETETEQAEETDKKETASAENNTEKETAAKSAAESEDEVAQQLMEKYDTGAGAYDGTVIKLDRSEPLIIELGYNPWQNEIDIKESFMVYQDAELQFPLEEIGYDYDGETSILTIDPPLCGIGEMDSSVIDLSQLNGSCLADKDENGWGMLAQYYLVTKVDTQTGAALETPAITVLKINTEISQAPQLVFSQTEDGYARFSWKEVKGAEGYLLFSINKDETGLWEYTNVFAKVTGTEWTSEGDSYEYEGKILSLNRQFEQYFISDDAQQWIDDNAPEWNEGEDEDVAYDEYYSEYYGVIAYNSEGCSPISNLLNAMDVAHMLPVEKADYADEDSFFGIGGTMGLPAVMSVTMADGSTAQRVIEYDFDTVTKQDDFNGFTVVGKAIQTPFAYEFHVYDVDFDVLDADLEAVKERQEKLLNKGGNVAPSLEIREESEAPSEEPIEEETAETEEEKTPEVSEEKEPEIKTDELAEAEFPITANSAMSEYIALHMLETEETISLEAFPEFADTEKVVDAFFEAQYQNPLILGVRGGSIDTNNKILYVEYDFDRKTTARKQEEIEQRVKEIVAEIIKSDMDDIQKGNAINAWLCENAVYDNDALANAELYSFTKVDEAFYDSFTAYGILLEGVGVCASYSAAYKLLADAAGLNSVVVTGYLDGSVPHAWNKVLLNEDWYIVDATNNDNDMIQNALLNISDMEAGSTLVEDDRYVMNHKVSAYKAEETEAEYYRSTNRYYDRGAIAEKLAEQLDANGNAVLRTEYNIDDEAFFEIAQSAADQAGKTINGFYWMGVIHLEE